ncbi:RICIN domain-containing protein [Flavobacteriaceae bacterium]|nr:RICIN domain-containing protein [Flavobacteriaceae bacterium]
MNRFFYFCVLIFFSSCSKGSDVDAVEMSFPETAEIYLLNNLDPGFVYPENLQYLSSREVKSSVCLDINAHIDVSITRPSVPAIVDPSNPTATPNTQASQNNDAGLDKPLRAHTCHSEQINTLFAGDFESGGISSDQGFDVSKISKGEFKLPFYNVCMEVENVGSSSGLVLRECDKNPKQQFVFEDDGKIKQVNDLSLCLTTSADYGWYGGGYKPIYIVRDLFMSACNPAFSERQSWGLRLDN